MKSLLKDLGSVTAIIGAQWGDEGKGKVTDILGEHFDVIARACGGANAGHTIVVNGKKHVFRLLPAGCLHETKPVILGSGMVIHLPTLLEEIDLLKKANVELVSRLHISSSAHILFDFHKEIDGAMEEKRSKSIGTTKKGIGPAYMDKAARSGIRMEKLFTDLKPELVERAKTVEQMYGVKVDVQKELENLEAAKKVLKGRFIESLPHFMSNLLENEKKTVVIEGAQATLLDLDHGTYPFVTSSYTTAAGALQGLALPPKALVSCIGIVKAYCTRVGSGDFLTEELGERGDRMRERGGEYGSVTGRPRRCGWLHIPDIKYSSFINGFTCINITKLDVLDEEDEIPVGTGAQNGKATYQTLKGWKTSTKGIKEFSKLPKEAQAYIEFIEKAAGCRIRLIGTGQGREEMIVR